MGGVTAAFPKTLAIFAGNRNTKVPLLVSCPHKYLFQVCSHGRLPDESRIAP